MNAFELDLSRYMDDAKDQHGPSNKARELAIMAITLHKFLEIMFSEIEKSGIQNIEFLAKSELFLRAITPSYKQENFNQLLEVLASIDENMIKSVLYYGLVSLRKICTGESDEPLNVYDKDGNFISVIEQKQTSECSFFITFLIENLIKYISDMRKTHSAKFETTNTFRKKIDDMFDDMVLETVTKIAKTLQS